MAATDCPVNGSAEPIADAVTFAATGHSLRSAQITAKQHFLDLGSMCAKVRLGELFKER
ncbi:hypothetical protein C7964_1155 [Loktanella sp. PT4BL]|jgi:hypothetical protein|nr:hypothetical protein C7964_1155 [Loktanella sp. PT4BL]